MRSLPNVLRGAFGGVPVTHRRVREMVATAGRGHARRRFATSLLVLLCLGASAAGGATAVPRIEAGMSLPEALLAFQEVGFSIVFSTTLVIDAMRIASVPEVSDPLQLLDALLAAHGLEARDGPQGVLLIVRGSSSEPGAVVVEGIVRSRSGGHPIGGAWVRVHELDLEEMTTAAGHFELGAVPEGVYSFEVRRPGFVVDDRALAVVAGLEGLEIWLQPAPLAGSEIAVNPSRLSLLRDDPAAPFALTRDQILALPQLGDDVFRALSLLPGVSSNDVTAQFNVRGGRREEVLVLLDGQELYEAYHLADFDRALSIVSSSEIARLDLTTGAFPSRYGDRMGAVLELFTIAPPKRHRRRLSLSVLDAQFQASGGETERVAWLASVRRGSADLAGRLVGQEDPEYWDAFGRIDLRVGGRQSLRLNLLRSSDDYVFDELLDGESRGFRTSYDATYAWLVHQGILSPTVFVDSALSTSVIDRDRRGFEIEEEKSFDIADRRELDVQGLRQVWNVSVGSHLLEIGAEARHYGIDYDYASDRHFDTPFAALRSPPREGRFDYRDRLRDDYLAGYVSDRIRLHPALTVELGLRHDDHSLSGDALWSPRVSAAWSIGTGVLRAAWGHYHQSQRAYEIAVIDGDTSIRHAERTEQWVVGYERVLATGPLEGLRIEVYDRKIADPRVRWESIFEPFEPFPEGELDRLRIAPERSRSQGIELLVRVVSRAASAGGRPTRWRGSRTASAGTGFRGRPTRPTASPSTYASPCLETGPSISPGATTPAGRPAKSVCWWSIRRPATMIPATTRNRTRQSPETSRGPHRNPSWSRSSRRTGSLASPTRTDSTCASAAPGTAPVGASPSSSTSRISTIGATSQASIWRSMKTAEPSFASPSCGRASSLRRGSVGSFEREGNGEWGMGKGASGEPVGWSRDAGPREDPT